MFHPQKLRFVPYSNLRFFRPLMNRFYPHSTTKYYLIIVLITTSCWGSSQIISVLKPGKKVNRVLFAQGQNIHLKTRAGDNIRGYIELISDTAILVQEKFIHPDSIAIIYDYSNRGFQQAGTIKFGIASVLFVGLTSLNRLGNKDRPVVPVQNLQVSAGLAGLSMLCAIGFREKFKLGKNAQLTILEG